MAMVASSFSSIPQHIVEEIMKSLPVKAVARFKCLSKHYLSYFTSFSFIYAHHLLSTLEPSLIFPLHSNLWFVNFNITTIINNKKTANNLVVAPPFDTLYKTRIVSCSFGLVCVSLRAFYTKVVVWNPATNEFRMLPESTVDVMEFMRTRTIAKVCLGFGFYRDFEDYKVVRIVYHLIATNPLELNAQVEVFTRSTATWRSIDLDREGVTNGFNMHQIKIKDCFPAAVANGVMYWNAVTENLAFIIAFDISNETFRGIPLPLACRDASYWSVLEWQKSIAIFVPEIGDRETAFDVWVTKNGGGGRGEPWIKVLNIGGFPEMTYPIMAYDGYRDRTNVIMNARRRGKSSNELIVYDMETKRASDILIDEVHSVHMAHHYAESLAPV